MRPVFVLFPGQFDNVGDTMHRRVLLDWLRPAGPVHVYVGRAAPASFIAGLRLGIEDRVYSSLMHWMLSIVRADGAPVLAFNPGEISLTGRRALREAALVPLLLIVRRRGGAVLRLGIAAGGNWTFSDWLTGRILRSVVRSFGPVWWREQRSRDLFEVGSVIPDLAFALGAPLFVHASKGADRELLIVTMRFDRPIPTPAWIEAVRRIATDQSLQLLVVSQVRRDNERCAQLATSLQAQLEVWQMRTHKDQEDRLRDLYGRASLVVSDRLHALIAAATEGSTPVALLTCASDKVAVHFATIGVSEVAMDTSVASTTEILAFANAARARQPSLVAAVEAARADLSGIRDELLRYVA